MVYYTVSESGRSRCPRRLIAQAAIVVAGTLALTSVVHADHSGSEADQAAREIQEVRDQADRAAQAMFEAESELDVLAVEVDQTRQRLTELEAEASEMRAVLETAALLRFVGGGGQHEIGVFDVGSMSDLQIAEVLGSVAQGTGAVAVDDLDALLDQVDTVRNELDHQRSDTESALERFEALKTNAEAKVLQLVELEETRQADAQVQHALERQRQERLEREAEAAAAAAAQQRSRASSGAASSGAATASAGGSRSSSVTGSSAGGTTASAPRATGTARTPAAPTPAPAPAPPPPPSSGSGMACPVGGASAYFNSWGAPRSGGRSHQGVDMMAPRGTPLVAAESGVASFSSNRLGGKVIWLSGSSGTRYYYAHLNGWAGSSRSVSRGEVIGYVGATGNTSANHLHFEVQPNGRSVNPYPYVVRAGC